MIYSDYTDVLRGNRISPPHGENAAKSYCPRDVPGATHIRAGDDIRVSAQS